MDGEKKISLGLPEVEKPLNQQETGNNNTKKIARKEPSEELNEIHEVVQTNHLKKKTKSECESTMSFSNNNSISDTPVRVIRRAYTGLDSEENFFP
eukprot:c16083_g1_i1.p1 GENE.c16083_g1_i1~~c16083_g1_i1.p1  ORF type:complete len:109 (-),score=40.30 c16083_g1_i1:69-356(-)